MPNCSVPCPQCPFSRATPKSYLDTKGDNAQRFIGQSVGPYDLPCHMTKEFENFFERFVNGEETKPCIGARRYRANIGVSHLLPFELTDMDLTTDFETVFGGHDELLAHHRGISIEEARKILADTPPSVMLSIEMMTRFGPVRDAKNPETEGEDGE